jgi:hypothetical protein
MGVVIAELPVFSSDPEEEKAEDSERGEGVKCRSSNVSGEFIFANVKLSCGCVSECARGEGERDGTHQCNGQV